MDAASRGDAQDVPAFVDLTPLHHGRPAERLGHRRVEGLRPIDDHHLVHRLTVVTRNVHDFDQFGIDLLNPFEHESDVRR